MDPTTLRDAVSCGLATGPERPLDELLGAWRTLGIERAPQLR